MESWEAQTSAVAALHEPTRRRLYNYVLSQHAPVSRDDAATVWGLPHSTGGFHLDRLVDEGPFHTLAPQHTDLICGMNLRLLKGILDGLGATEAGRAAASHPYKCCVRLKRAPCR